MVNNAAFKTIFAWEFPFPYDSYYDMIDCKAMIYTPGKQSRLCELRQTVMHHMGQMLIPFARTRTHTRAHTHTHTHSPASTHTPNVLSARFVKSFLKKRQQL